MRFIKHRFAKEDQINCFTRKDQRKYPCSLWKSQKRNKKIQERRVTVIDKTAYYDKSALVHSGFGRERKLLKILIVLCWKPVGIYQEDNQRDPVHGPAIMCL